MLTDFSAPRPSVNKCIVIEDSHKKIMGPYYRTSSVVTGRNPWFRDNNLDYEMDSEDELAEEQGEDLNSKQVGDEDEEMVSGEEEEEFKGFIV